MNAAITILEILAVWFVVALAGGIIVGKCIKGRNA